MPVHEINPEVFQTVNRPWYLSTNNNNSSGPGIIVIGGEVPGAAGGLENLRIYFMHRHVLDTVEILYEGSRPHL